MTVLELKNKLNNYPDELEVVYHCFSEFSLLEEEEPHIEKLCMSRDDGWVANYRPDKETKDYLAFPGN